MTPVHFSLSSAFILGLMGVAFHRTHQLSALSCLAGMMWSLFIALPLWALQFESTAFSTAPQLHLAFSACQASTALALLIATAGTHGNDRLQILNLLQC
uniref:NADH-ubiquinone oxidoreductase chain 4L n=1 Tax=Danio margaritatus TaxID=487618 RepID=A0A0S1YCL8_9TELE|nr:NADH dehydrogenase subunit 4L [Danio margaritatus]ALM87969.1 NADH dehydrogenase subunit 4L [Danio margaritatus]